MNGVMRSAARDRLIGQNPCDGIRLPRDRKRDVADQFLTREEFARLLPEIPERYRALVALSAGTGLRWGECLGLRWQAVDLDEGVLRVLRVATEVNGLVLIKPYPKSKAGRREVPLPGFVVQALQDHREAFPTREVDEIFANEAGGPLRRSMFRSRVWRPALVRTGLLGEVVSLDGERFCGQWTDAAGVTRSEEYASHKEAVRMVARNAVGGVRFHDLRHSYATWLISDGVPINDVAAAMGHEQVSTTLNRYTHPSADRRERVRAVFADFLLTPEASSDPGNDAAPPRGGADLSFRSVELRGLEPLTPSMPSTESRAPAWKHCSLRSVRTSADVCGGPRLSGAIVTQFVTQ